MTRENIVIDSIDFLFSGIDITDQEFLLFVSGQSKQQIVIVVDKKLLINKKIEIDSDGTLKIDLISCKITRAIKRFKSYLINNVIFC